MKRPLHYILVDGIPKGLPDEQLLEWGRWMADHRQDTIVKQTKLGDKIWVSTVFLGVDHSFRPEGDPVLFETMVFREGEGQEMYRYSFWPEAEQGHDRIVAELEKTTGLLATIIEGAKQLE